MKENRRQKYSNSLYWLRRSSKNHACYCTAVSNLRDIDKINEVHLFFDVFCTIFMLSRRRNSTWHGSCSTHEKVDVRSTKEYELHTLYICVCLTCPVPWNEGSWGVYSRPEQSRNVLLRRDQLPKFPRVSGPSAPNRTVFSFN